jgi:hypothetical protein
MNEKEFDKEFDLMGHIIKSILTDTRTDFVEFNDTIR